MRLIIINKHQINIVISLCGLCVLPCVLCGKERKSNVAVFTNRQKVIPRVRINQRILPPSRQVRRKGRKERRYDRYGFSVSLHSIYRI